MDKSKPVYAELKKQTVEAVTPPSEGYVTITDTKLSGFGLRVTAAGVRSYIVQGRANGRSRRVTIGRHGVLTAEEARRRARKVLGDMSAGIDPVAEKKRKKAEATTLRELAEGYCENKRRRKDGKPLAERTKADIMGHLRRSFSAWADKPVSSITDDQVRRWYNAKADHSQAQANQALRILAALLKHAVALGYVSTNAAQGVQAAGYYRGDVQGRDTTIPADRIGAFYNATDAARHTGSPSQRIKATAAYLLMLTGLRQGDLLKRTWRDVDLDAATLFVPDTKHRSPRTFPLATQCVDALRDLHALTGADEYVFSANGAVGHCGEIRQGLAPGIEATGQHIGAHDLRRTWIAAVNAAKVDALAAELLANRKGEVFQALAVRLENYDTSDLSVHYREPAQRIADWFEGQGRIAAADNVVTLESRA